MENLVGGKFNFRFNDTVKKKIGELKANEIKKLKETRQRITKNLMKKYDNLDKKSNYKKAKEEFNKRYIQAVKRLNKINKVELIDEKPKKVIKTKIIKKVDILDEIDKILKKQEEEDKVFEDEHKKTMEIIKEMNEDIKQDKFKKDVNERLLKLLNEKKGIENFKIGDNIQLLKIVLEQIKQILYGLNVVLEVNNTYYAVNDNTVNRLINSIQDNNTFEDVILISPSDAELFRYIAEIEEVKVILKSKEYKKRIGGAFFKYLNNTDLDLKKYQIYKNDDKKEYDDNCLIYSLKMGGLESNKIDHLKTYCKNREIPKTDLKHICKQLEIIIKLKSENRKEIETFGESGNIYNLGLIDSHYFLNDYISVSEYYIKNYNKLKDIKDNKTIIKTKIKNDKIYYERNKDIKTQSYFIIKALKDNKEECLKDLDICQDVLKSVYSDKIKEIIDLDFDDELNCQQVKYKEIKKDIDYKDNIYFCDFETYSDEKGYQKPYILCCIDKNDNFLKYTDDNCGLKFLRSLENDSLLIFHNADFDVRFLISYGFNIKEIERNNSLMDLKMKIKNNKNKIIDVKIKCSYKMIPMKLSSFSDCFFDKNEQKEYIKDVMPYDLYNKDNINKRFVNIDEGLKYLKKDEQNIFLDNIRRWKLKLDDKFDIMGYSLNYCFQDCKILKKGWGVFRNWILNDLEGLDINDIITISSLADRYLTLKGCYDGIYSLSGKPQQFIMKGTIGGRCQTNNNKMIKCDKRLNDLDCVSLYPSSMVRFDGFLKGKPFVISQENLKYDIIKNYSGYFIDIKILKVGIKRNFSLMSEIIEGIRQFHNDFEGKILNAIDKYTLEDLIKFQKIEFEIIRGYGYNNGYNNKINDVIQYLFNKRLELKQKNNPSEIIYKLILNSAYGKTILKAENTKIIYINGKNIIEDGKKKWLNGDEVFEKFQQKYYNYIHSWTKLKDTDDKYRVKIYKSIENHFNRPQCGNMILSMSKRIMNEVLCLSEDNNIKIYYVDTDSIHIEDDKIEKLTKLFKNEYKRDMIGKNLGQLHSDFQISDEKGNKIKDLEKISSVKSIFLGKKCYIDKLEGVKKSGEIINDFHTRLKGVSPASMKHYIKNNNIDMFELYEKLYNNENISFDQLCIKDGKISQVKFKKCFNKNIRKYTEEDRFIRNIMFKDVKNKIYDANDDININDIDDENDEI